MLHSLKEITIIPTTISDIDSRSECNPYYENNNLPLFTAPMSAVVGEKSFEKYLENQITPIIPRNIPIKRRLSLLQQWDIFIAFSLQEIEEYILGNKINTLCTGQFSILIDIANGNMQKMFTLVKQLKEEYSKNIIIMAGNIANPETYEKYCKAGIDYCRVGIGGGSSCNTSTFTGIHYPMGSLLKECNTIKEIYKNLSIQNVGLNPTKIIADGGIKGYSDIIKCLALGADYVMCGSVFAKMEESEAEIFEEIFLSESNSFKKYSVKKAKKFYGMSTPKAQIELGGNGFKATEGNETIIPVEYTMEEWVSNFKAYLRSAMSYCGKRTLQEFIGKVNIGIMSENSVNNINK